MRFKTYFFFAQLNIFKLNLKISKAWSLNYRYLWRVQIAEYDHHGISTRNWINPFGLQNSMLDSVLTLEWILIQILFILREKKKLLKQANNGVQRKLGLWPHHQNLNMMNNLKVLLRNRNKIDSVPYFWKVKFKWPLLLHPYTPVYFKY